MKTKTSRKRIEQEIKALAEMPESVIDTSDIPEITDFSGAIRGPYYRPIKKRVTIHIDADVLAWLRSAGAGYQTRLNGHLREKMLQSLTARQASGHRIPPHPVKTGKRTSQTK